MDEMWQEFKSNTKDIFELIKHDRILIFAIIIVSILSIGNVLNKAILGFEPLQYSLFSYDKILHLLMSIIIVRIIYILITQFEPYRKVKHPRIVASVLAFVLYALIWEPFELLTFMIQNSDPDQIKHELIDVPLDWLYDIIGVVLSYILGYD
ncbi:MAG: hypothetical protein ACW99F_10205 [Candidatus Hodarchaeales archaeon]|jgi:hypothetical protein